MEMTLSPNLEREAIREIKSRKGAETPRPLFVQLAKFAASRRKGSVWHGLVQFGAHRVIGWVESRNDELANHLRWFRGATEDLKIKVERTGIAAGTDLGSALDGLVRRVDSCTNSLLPLLAKVQIDTPFGAQVHRSTRLLLQLKWAAIEMRRAGGLCDGPDEVTLRIEVGLRQMLDDSAPHRPVSIDPQLASLAAQVLARRRSATKPPPLLEIA